MTKTSAVEVDSTLSGLPTERVRRPLDEVLHKWQADVLLVTVNAQIVEDDNV